MARAKRTPAPNGRRAAALLPHLVPLPLAMLFASPALAHEATGLLGGFGSGFGHPLAGFDHFLAMLAVGLWGAQMGGRSVWTLPATFPLIMCIGGVLGMIDIGLGSQIETGITLSLIVLGGAIAARWIAPEWAALLIVAIFAFFHGYPHGQEAPRAVDPAAYTVGFVVSTGLIHIFGIGVGFGLGRFFEGRIVRALGLVIAACGVYFLVT